MKKLSLNSFLEKCTETHGDKYDYSLICEYLNKSQKIDIICKLHGKFTQIAGNHLYHKHGCPSCGLKIRNKSKNYLELFKVKHGDKYDYSMVEYYSMKKKVKIKCNIHGEFEQTPLSHIRGSGCKYCGVLKMSKSLVKPVIDFIKDCNHIHNNLYDYSKVEYNTLGDKVIIICKEHGDFKQIAFSHQQGNGCKKCNKSKGEIKIENYLKSNNIDYEYNKHFETCRNKNTLPFDFYIPQYNICIEYDGIQHYESISYFGGDSKLTYQMRLDEIKNTWCFINNIKLLRIDYKNYKNIENILDNNLYK